MTTPKVSTSASGTASQMPSTSSSRGSPKKQSTMKTNPRRRVTNMAGRARSTLWK